MTKNLISFMFIFTLTSISYAKKSSELKSLNNQKTVRTLIILSERYVNYYKGSVDQSLEPVRRELQRVNKSLLVQGVNLNFKVVGVEHSSLSNEYNPSETCVGFTGDAHWGIEANENLAQFSNRRKKYQADVVILMIKSTNPDIKETNNFGIACSTNFHTADRKDRDNSFLIVEQLGLKALTLPHELGHFLGVLHHEYALIDSDQATIMIANGNKEGLHRKLYWSDESFSLKGKRLGPVSEGVSDISLIRKNFQRSVNAFENWLKQ